MPELAPVTIAFWPLSNLRFSVFGTTGFGRSPKVCACGIFGFGRLIASGGMVGIGVSFFVLRIRRADERFLTTDVVAGGVDPGSPKKLPRARSAGVNAAGYKRNSSISPCHG